MRAFLTGPTIGGFGRSQSLSEGGAMDGRAAATSRLAAYVPAVGSARKRRASTQSSPR
jgi:hypothetical protein